MSKEIGVVKNVTQGSVKAVSPTGESRELKVGDIVYQGEKIVTESTDAKVVIAKADGKRDKPNRQRLNKFRPKR